MALLATVAAFALAVSPAFGEGSVDFNTGPDANSRHGLQMTTGSSLITTGYNVLYVYAQAGETIQLGSSAMGVAGAGNIRVYAPGTNLEALTFPSDPAFANDVWDCDTDDPGTGVIAEGATGRLQEIAGPEPSGGDADPDTWVPCEYTPTSTGIHPVIMWPPDPAGLTNQTSGTVGVPNQNAEAQIAIWDITVRDGAGAVQLGRVFADQYNVFEGVTPVPGGGGAEVFVYTRTGYEYQVNMFNHNGAGWTLRADDQGIVTTPGGERLFSSFDCRLNTTDPVNVCSDTRAGFAPPGGRYPLFLNRPAAVAVSGAGGLAATRGYATAPISPASQPLAATFTGSGGGAGVTNHGSGGAINVTAPTQMGGLGNTLEIDLNRNGTFGDAPDHVASQDLEADGSSAYAWSGRDAAGNQPACGDYNYRVRSTLAEIHFPMQDVETSGGTQIQRLSLPTDTTLGDPRTAYYNDVDRLKQRNVTDANPISVPNGAISGPTFHAWGDPNDATAVGGGDTDFIDTWVQLPEVLATGTLRLLCSDPTVRKSTEQPAAVPGEDLTFRVAVTNNGPDTANDVVATDDLPDTVQFKSASQGCAEAGSVVTCSVASLAAGATHTFEIVVGVPSSVDECIDNPVHVTNSTPPDTNPNNNDDRICVPLNRRSDLSIAKDPSRTEVGQGGQLMFTLVVQNEGPSDDPNVDVIDPLVPGLTLVAADPSQGTCSTANNTLDCELGGLKDGGSAQVLVTAQLSGTQCVTNTARIRGANTDPNPANDQDDARVCPAPPPDPRFDLVVTKTVNDRTLLVGQTARYRVVVRNDGPDAAPDAKVTDTLNAPVSVRSVKTPQGSCTKTIPMRCELGRIEAGASVTITIRVKHREATGCSPRQRNAASATGNGTDVNPANNLDTVDVCVRKVKPTISKVANRTAVRGGETFGYRIRVRNPTKGEARNVRVCDRLPSGLRYVSSKPAARRSGRQQCWTIKVLKARQTRTYRITVRAANGASGRKTNTATLSGPDITRVRARDRVLISPQPDRPTG